MESFANRHIHRAARGMKVAHMGLCGCSSTLGLLTDSVDLSRAEELFK
jgi:hypothetical protein